MSERIARFLVRWRVAVTGVLLLLTFPAARIVWDRLRIDNAIEGWFAKDDASFSRYRSFVVRFGHEGFFTIGFASDDVFSRRSLSLVHALTADLKTLSEVRDVVSLTTVPAPVLKGKAVSLAPLIGDPAKRTDSEIEEARRTLIHHPIYSGTVLDRYGTTAFVVGLVGPLSVEGKHALRCQLDPLVAHHAAASGVHLHLAGAPILDAELDRVSRGDVLLFIPLLAGILTLVLLLVSRSVAVVFACLLGVATGLAATFSLFAWLELPFTLVTGLIPPLFLTIGVASTVHLYVRYEQIRRRDPETPRDEALRQAYAQTLKPTLFSALTTAAGLAGLVTCTILPVQIVGAFAAGGVLAASLAPIGYLPFFVLTLGGVEARPRRPLIDWTRIFRRIGIFALRERSFVLLTSGLLLVLAAAGIYFLRTEVDVLRFLTETNSVRQDYEFTEARLGGISPVEIVFEASPGAFGEVENLERLRVVEAYAQKMGGTVQTVSVIDYMDAVEYAWESLDRDRFTLDLPVSGQVVRLALDLSPRNPERVVLEAARQAAEDDMALLLARVLEDLRKTRAGPIFGDDDVTKRTEAILRLLEEKGLAEGYLTPDRGAARLTVLARSWTTAEARRDLDDLEAFARRTAGDPIRVEVTGLVSLYQALDRSLIDSQARSALLAFGLVLLFVSLAVRSSSFGLILMIPNLLPVAMTLGLMGWTGVPLNMATILIVGVAIGIAVDDTIHYSARFAEQRASGRSLTVSALKAHATVGPSMAATTLVLVAGFSALAASRFAPTVAFGLLVALTILLALLADLILLPALLVSCPCRQAPPKPGRPS